MYTLNIKKKVFSAFLKSFQHFKDVIKLRLSQLFFNNTITFSFRSLGRKKLLSTYLAMRSYLQGQDSIEHKNSFGAFTELLHKFNVDRQFNKCFALTSEQVF